MRSSATSFSSRHGDLFSTPTFQEIQALEQAYRGRIRGPGRDADSAGDLLGGLDAAFARLARRARGWQRVLPARAGEEGTAARIWSDYLGSVTGYHQRIRAWLSLYADLCRPDASAPDGASARQQAAAWRQIREDAQRLWATFSDPSASAPSGPVPPARIREIVRLKDELDRLPVNSAAWRVRYRRLTRTVHTALRAVLRDGKYAFKDRFRIATATRILAPQGRPAAGEASWVADRVRGYPRDAQAVLSRALGRDSAAAGRQFRRAEARRRIRQGLRLVMLIVIVGGAITSLRVTGTDRRLWQAASSGILRLLGQDPAAKILREKQDFFDQQIAAMDPTAIAEGIRAYLAGLGTGPLDQSKQAYEDFAQQVVRGFILLLAQQQADPALQSEVVSAAARLTSEISEPLARIAALYSGQTIRESDLRDQTLALRRAFLRRGVFPFLFTVLKDDVPYLFLFPEWVVSSHVLGANAKRLIDLPEEVYQRLPFGSTVAFLVRGTRYPFRDRAGYYDGEFAVAFQAFSPQPMWTVYHEVAHLIDHLRFLYQGRPIPDNGEVNAMLFPLLWAKDRRDYLSQRLVPSALTRDPDDFYAQAAKGILNGLMLYLAERDLTEAVVPISNQFEPQLIQQAGQRLGRIDSVELKRMGYALYQDPERYLSTAYPGRYLPQDSNVQELTHGLPHGIVQRGFVLSGGRFGRLRQGPRFIPDGAGTDDGTSLPFSLGAFLKNVLRIAFGRADGLPQSTRGEAAAAAVLVFCSFNGLAFLLHRLSARYRRRMFYGRSPAEWIDQIYDWHPWSDGKNQGAESRERDLLTRVMAGAGEPGPALRQELAAFKATADQRARILFDLCLFLAPFEPGRARIRNQAHDLLFFLPFAGPYLGRAAWLWPVQRAFHQREAYNAALAEWLSGLSGLPAVPQLLKDFQRLAAAHGVTVQPGASLVGTDDLAALERLVFSQLSEGSRRYHMNIKLITAPAAELTDASQEFDHLSEYHYGDDIRRIDWKATARSVTARPLVRRYRSPVGCKVGFWLDMRWLEREEDRQIWARHFARSITVLNMAGAETILERLLLVLRDGTVHDEVVNIRTHSNSCVMAEQVLRRVRETVLRIQAQDLTLAVRGLPFYNAAENGIFQQITGLSDLTGGAQGIKWQRIQARRLNIFVVGGPSAVEAGAGPGDALQQDMAAVLGEDNKIFYW